MKNTLFANLDGNWNNINVEPKSTTVLIWEGLAESAKLIKEAQERLRARHKNTVELSIFSDSVAGKVRYTIEGKTMFNKKLTVEEFLIARNKAIEYAKTNGMKAHIDKDLYANPYEGGNTDIFDYS